MTTYQYLKLGRKRPFCISDTNGRSLCGKIAVGDVGVVRWASAPEPYDDWTVCDECLAIQEQSDERVV